MLAMDLRTTRGVRFPALSLTTIASMLAPTGGLRFYWVTHRVTVVSRFTSPSARISPITWVLSEVWQVVSGGGGGAAGGGGGGLEQPPIITAHNATGAKTRFPRLFIG
jgi:hypothetical protein